MTFRGRADSGSGLGIPSCTLVVGGVGTVCVASRRFQKSRGCEIDEPPDAKVDLI